MVVFSFFSTLVALHLVVVVVVRRCDVVFLDGAIFLFVFFLSFLVADTVLDLVLVLATVLDAVSYIQ